MSEKFPPRVTFFEFEIPSYADKDGEIEYLSLAEHEHLIASLEADLAAAKERIAFDEGYYQDLTAENARLKAALEEYGDHDLRCAVWNDTSAKGCTCGFSQALTPAPEQGEVENSHG